jgi:acetylornithine deacetylase/succinyl-diaminopimelate desuccinylase-like protein
VVDAEAVIARLRETDVRSGGAREAWGAEWLAERGRLDALARSIADSVTVETDAFANTWYVLPGEDAETVLVGSHSDCVPGGGWLDGILGIHAGLGVLAAVADGPRPPRTLAVVDWADEEGTRFGRSLLGSSAATGALTVSELRGLADAGGNPGPDVVSRFGFDAHALVGPVPDALPDAPVRPVPDALPDAPACPLPDALAGPLAGAGWPDSASRLRSPRLAQVVAACELHIEQGPTLQRSGRSVAAVSGCLGVRRQQITFTGEAGHAGATPMADRRDPVRDAARWLASLADAAQGAGGLATAGRIEAEPAIPTAVARRCRLSLDLRHADLDQLRVLEARAMELFGESRCEIYLGSQYRQDPVTFDPTLVRLAASVCGGGDPVRSGPLHDSAALAQAGIPTVMLFCASLGGISHSRAEDTSEPDLVAGVQALHRLVTRLLESPRAAGEAPR